MKRLIFRNVGTVMLCGLLAGCAVGTPKDLVRFKHYEPQNVFADGAVLPKNIRRVVVLPLVCDERDMNLDQGRAKLEPVLLSELVKTKKFEVVASDQAILKERTARTD